MTKNDLIKTASDYDVIAWDLDDTIVDSKKHHVAAYKTAIETYGIKIDYDKFIMDLDVGSVFALSNQNITDDTIHKILARKKELFYDEVNNIRSFKHIHDLVIALANMNRTQVIISNSSGENADIILKNNDLHKYFDIVQTRDDCDTLKPNPLRGEFIKDKVVLYIGDSATDKKFAYNMEWDYIDVACILNKTLKIP